MRGYRNYMSPEPEMDRIGTGKVHWHGYDRWGADAHKVACGIYRGPDTNIAFDSPGAVTCERCIRYLDKEA